MIPGVMIEAEHHAVWQSPKGMLICVSPHLQGERMIVFAPDPRTPFIGHTIDNVRRALVDEKVVEEFIEFGRARYEEMQHAKPGELVSLRVDIKAQVDLNLRFSRFALSKRGKGDPCTCGSRKPFGKCCNLDPDDLTLEHIVL
jgi:uncharacterized protein YchJ